MEMQAIYNPRKDVALNLNGMQLNKIICVQGVTHDYSEGSYYVNLLCGSNTGDEADIALHINPRFYQRAIVRNDYKPYRWGEEELEGGFPHPSYGYKFNLWITCREHYFEIHFDADEMFTTFTHRRVYEDVTHVLLVGDCDFKIVWATMEHQEPVKKTIVRPELPFNEEMPFQDGSGMNGHSVLLYGAPTSDYGRMEFNFVDYDGNYHLHFNPRMEERTIARNHYDVDKGYFDVNREENQLDTPFPFIRDVDFMIKVTEDDYGFQVEINGGKAFHFRHRRDNINEVTRLMVKGDVSIRKIKYH